MSLGPWQVLLIAVVVLVLFGRGKISSLMGEVGKGITSFNQNFALLLLYQTFVISFGISVKECEFTELFIWYYP